MRSQDRALHCSASRGKNDKIETRARIMALLTDNYYTIGRINKVNLYTAPV